MKIIFYEKPGCLSNSKQKALLESSGYHLEVHNLLTEPWTAERLRSFFGSRPVAEWFNLTAPRLKAGEIDPKQLDEQQALACMLADPLLIRRPLMETANQRCCGFEAGPFLDALGISLTPQQDLQSCSKPESNAYCKLPGESE